MHDAKNLRFLPLEQATAYPQADCEILNDRYWAHLPGKGLVFCSRNRYMMAPQCNSDRRVADQVIAKLYPEAEVLFVPTVYLTREWLPRPHPDDY